MRINNNTLAVFYSESPQVVFRLFSIEESTITPIGYFKNGFNIAADFKHTESCQLSCIDPSGFDIYLAVHCSQSDRNYYSKCRINANQTFLDCSSDLTFFDSDISKLNSVSAIMRKKSRRSESDRDIQYYFADNKLFMVDFDKKVKQDVF
jgi:hypothetical protein